MARPQARWRIAAWAREDRTVVPVPTQALAIGDDVANLLRQLRGPSTPAFEAAIEHAATWVLRMGPITRQHVTTALEDMTPEVRRALFAALYRAAGEVVPGERPATFERIRTMLPCLPGEERYLRLFQYVMNAAIAMPDEAVGIARVEAENLALLAQQLTSEQLRQHLLQSLGRLGESVPSTAQAILVSLAMRLAREDRDDDSVLLALIDCLPTLTHDVQARTLQALDEAASVRPEPRGAALRQALADVRRSPVAHAGDGADHQRRPAGPAADA